MAARKSAKRPARKSAKKTVRRVVKRVQKALRRKPKLTKRQLAQRKYAASMRGVRKRAKSAKGGKGRVAKRAGATKLRRQLGLKAGK